MEKSIMHVMKGATYMALDKEVQGGRWPSGLDRWLALATGRCGTGLNPTAGNFASELWQFRLPRFTTVFRRSH